MLNLKPRLRRARNIRIISMGLVLQKGRGTMSNHVVGYGNRSITSSFTCSWGNGREGKMEFEQSAEPSSPSVATEKPRGKQTKDSIDIRARRGQATNSHSVAERVRREKINERMKLLQDLVPGCSKASFFHSP
ncbi:hypothetical protein ZIOFF_023307 [Zingiber officinale]|uniref:BHLH domain-containing protein n=1 Tax=Zingiber officinale TaxID=94328 RepID=A0A8J5LKU7_ZINOF|nr:hypothetical protein ZIOFF_023307 [Zingiber officinale]